MSDRNNGDTQMTNHDTSETRSFFMQMACLLTALGAFVYMSFVHTNLVDIVCSGLVVLTLGVFSWLRGCRNLRDALTIPVK